MLSYKEFLAQQIALKEGTAVVEKDEESLFNFRWRQSKLDQLKSLAEERGVTATSIVKGLLLIEFEQEAIKAKERSVPK